MATRKKIEEMTPEVQEQAQVNAEAVEANAEVAALKAKIAALEAEAESRDAAIQALVEENNALRAAANNNDKSAMPDLRPYMINLKGKQYLTVAGRLVWFNAVNADGHIGIETHFDVLDLDKKIAVCTCTLRDRRDGTILAQATKMEDAKGFVDFAEKAQTGALGRALALIVGPGASRLSDSGSPAAHGGLLRPRHKHVTKLYLAASPDWRKYQALLICLAGLVACEP